MWKIIAVALLLGGCSSLGFNDPTKKTTVVTNTSVVYPDLPDIDKPLPPVQQPVTWDYPRDKTKAKVVKTTPECLQQPPIANFDKACLEYPVDKSSNLFVGLDSVGFKNWFSNQESLNGYIRSLLTRIDEVNAERAKWRESNQQKDK